MRSNRLVISVQEWVAYGEGYKRLGWKILKCGYQRVILHRG